jgi:hypothetical protein
MYRKLLICCLMMSFSLLVFSLASGALAEDGKGSLRIWGQVSPFLSGDAGTGSGAPEYGDAFSEGLGFGAEFSWRFCRWFSALGGLGFERFDGKTYEGISFGELKVFPVYVGGKIHLVEETSPWDFYLRFDAGATRLSSVNVSYGAFRGQYWDSSWVFLFDAGVGTEYRWDCWGLSLDVKARYLGSPDPAMGDPSDADASWTLPVVFGINYHF